MAGRMPQNQTPRSIVSKEMEMEMEMEIGTILKKPGIGLMQNCDLPPPLKVFPGNEMMVVLQSKNRVCSVTTREEESMWSVSERNEKLEILKALRLSQTRAREAEKRAEVLAKERDTISNALLHESTQLFAYRQWVKLLELKVSLLQRQHQGTVKKEDDGNGGGGMVLFVALALCIGIASLGYALVADTYLDSFLV